MNTKQTEALKLALEWIEGNGKYEDGDKIAIAIREALAQPEQKYRRGDRLVCLETDEYCVIHIAGTDRQWIKFPDTHIGVYTNEQVDQLFEKLAKETDLAQPEQEPVAWADMDVRGEDKGLSWTPGYFHKTPLYTTPPHRKPLTDEEIMNLCASEWASHPIEVARVIEAAHGIKENKK